MLIMFIHIFKLYTIVLLIQQSPSDRGTDSDSTNWNQIWPYLIFLTQSSILPYKMVLILIIGISDLVRFGN